MSALDVKLGGAAVARRQPRATRQLLVPAFIASAQLLIASSASSQPREGQLVDAAVGLGVSVPSYDSNARGSGVLAKAEYVVGLSSWAGVRAYGGLLWTWPEDSEPPCRHGELSCEVTAKVGLLGGKGRIAAPIPWVAPFFELGFGVSFGELRTRTTYVNLLKHGLAFHTPLTLGFAFGPDHEAEFAFVYYFHPQVSQVNGGVTVGLSFPIERPNEPSPR